MQQQPTKRRSAPRKDALRQRIVTAVKDLHEAGGYDAVTMRAVADAIGMAPMSLYRHFANKAALLEGVWTDVLGEALAAARAPLDGLRTPQTRLRAYYEGYIGFWLERPNAYWMIFDIRGASPNYAFFEAGPAAEFRNEAQALVGACLPKTTPPAARTLAHDLCRCKVIGFLYLAVALNRGRRDVTPVYHALLDDIERQVRAPLPRAAAAAPRRTTKTVR